MTVESYKPQTPDETSVLEIYYELLDAWNTQDAHRFAHLFSGTAYVIGFDGSHMIGQSQVEDELKNIFAEHRTGTYKTKVRDIRRLDAHCMLLFAITGIVPPGESMIDPSKNALQVLVVSRNDEGWLIDLLQNTPAQLHGRPELSADLTKELQELT